jgi:hypothetical protein
MDFHIPLTEFDLQSFLDQKIRDRSKRKNASLMQKTSLAVSEPEWSYIDHWRHHAFGVKSQPFIYAPESEGPLFKLFSTWGTELNTVDAKEVWERRESIHLRIENVDGEKRRAGISCLCGEPSLEEKAPDNRMVKPSVDGPFKMRTLYVFEKMTFDHPDVHSSERLFVGTLDNKAQQQLLPYIKDRAMRKSLLLLFS